jgi:hypothetical protein
MSMVKIGNAYMTFIRKPEEQILLGGLSAGMMIILKFIFEKRCKGMNWMQMAEEKVRCWVLLKSVNGHSCSTEEGELLSE